MKNNKTTKIEQEDRKLMNYAWFIFTLDPKEDIKELSVQRMLFQHLEGGTSDTSNFVTAF